MSSQHTGTQPNLDLFAALTELQMTPGVSNIEFAMGFPPADVRDAGASITVFGNDQASVDSACAAFYKLVLKAESAFKDQLLTTEQALALVNESALPGPAILADVQDNPGAGGTADTTGMLAELVAGGARETVIAALADGQAAAQAHAAGVGSTIRLALGGNSGLSELGAYHADYQVMALGSGNFTCSSAMYAGCQVELGPMALLKVVDENSDVQVIVSTERYACTDLAVYDHLGLTPTDFRILAVKSTVHFRAAFEPISEQILMVEVPGVHPCRLESLHYSNLRDGVRLGPGGPLHSL